MLQPLLAVHRCWAPQSRSAHQLRSCGLGPAHPLTIVINCVRAEAGLAPILLQGCRDAFTASHRVLALTAGHHARHRHPKRCSIELEACNACHVRSTSTSKHEPCRRFHKPDQLAGHRLADVVSKDRTRTIIPCSYSMISAVLMLKPAFASGSRPFCVT